jgi:lipooligosaccharide transport system ATP-binding protein
MFTSVVVVPGHGHWHNSILIIVCGGGNFTAAMVESGTTATTEHDLARPPAVVEARGLGKRFGERRAVADLDLDVPRGQCLGLLGPNGAGKTTTLRMIYGVTRPDAGSIRVFGIDVASDARAVRRRLGVTLQDNVMIDTLTPRENLRVFGRFHGLRAAALEARIGEVLDFLDLGSHADALARNLSGGFRRRLAVAMSLINRPELLILDEPTTGLDPAVRHALWSRFRALGAGGTTVLLTTHYMDEAERLCDRVVIMADGRALRAGAPGELIAATLEPEAIELDCPETEEAALLGAFADGTKKLRVGNRLMVFTADAGPLLARIRDHDGGERRPVIVRPANLEDVFLSITGTGLEEGA